LLTSQCEQIAAAC